MSVSVGAIMQSLTGHVKTNYNLCKFDEAEFVPSSNQLSSAAQNECKDKFVGEKWLIKILEGYEQTKWNSFL